MSFFEINDEVFDIRFGKGKVIAIHDGRYPIEVKFQNKEATRTYTTEGKYYEIDHLPTLYHAEGFVPPSAPEPERCPFKEGDIVLVRVSEVDSWECHVFKKYLGKDTTLFPFCCSHNTQYGYCIPFKGNEHLLDTKLEPEDDNNAD